MIITRRAFTAALSLTGLVALAGLAPLHLIGEAMAQSASDVAKPVSLPDMALGPANASVTITEFASMTCPHCAAFNEAVFPKIKSEYIDTGKVRYVFREFPLDIKAAAGSMLARCIAKDDAGKYFAVVDLLFRQQLAGFIASRRISDFGGAAAHKHNRFMPGLLQPPQGHQLHEIADMHALRCAVEADIGGDPFFQEECVEILRSRAIVVGATLDKRAKEV